MRDFSDISDPDWPSILRQVQDNVQARIHTQCPGTVISYDSATQKASVQIAVQLQGVSAPPLSGVPVVWPGGAAGFLHVPLEAGDNVTLLFAEQDFSKWLKTGSVSAPAMLQRHGLYAIAVPGLHRTPLTVTGGHVTLASTGELRLGSDSASAFVALASLVVTRLQAMQTAIDAHTHSGVTTGPGASGPPAPVIVWPTSNIAATKVKAT